MNKSLWACAAVIAALVGCSSESGPCTAAECAAVCPPAGAASPAPAAAPAPGAAAGAAAPAAMTSFQQGLVSPLLADIAEGVRPWTAEGIGLCRGVKECDAYLGMDGGELPPGDYMVRAELRVPRVGEKDMWKVRFISDCVTTTVSGSSTSTSNNHYEKEYSVNYINEERGARLQPLYKITSPNKGGQRECKYQVITLHPDGDKTFAGSFTLPPG